MTVRIKFNEAGFRALLTSGAANSLVKEHAERVAERANEVPSTTQPAASDPYYVVEDASDDKRARYRVRANGARAMAHEAKTQALLRAIS
ncbi:hypothetical protein [Mycobacterium sp. HM-7]